MRLVFAIKGHFESTQSTRVLRATSEGLIVYGASDEVALKTSVMPCMRF